MIITKKRVSANKDNDLEADYDAEFLGYKTDGYETKKIKEQRNYRLAKRYYDLKIKQSKKVWTAEKETAERKSMKQILRELLLFNFPLILHIANREYKRFQIRHLEMSKPSFGEVLQEFAIGFLHGIEKFNPYAESKNSEQVKLTTYAGNYAKTYIKNKYGRNPRYIIRNRVKPAQSIYEEDEEGHSLDDVIEDKETRKPLDDVLKEERDEKSKKITEKCLEFVSFIDPRMPYILCYRFGLSGVQKRSLKQIGLDIGRIFRKPLTRSRVQQLEKQALNYAKEEFCNDGLSYFR